MFSVKGTKSETRSLFSSLCVFHFIIMQKIYYIRVVFVCLLLLVSLAFSRRYKFVNKKILKRKKNIILCVCEVVNFYFFREQRPTQNGRAGSFVIFFFFSFALFFITDTLKETTSLRNGWKIVNCQSLIALLLSLSNSSTFISLRLGDGTRGSSIRGVVPCTRCCVDAAHEEPGNGKEDNKEL